MRQMRCGGAPVMSRPSSSTRPPSGMIWPVIRLKRVDFPAPFGPTTAAIWRVSTVRLTPPTATKPANALCKSWTSSIAARDPAPGETKSGDNAADDAAGEHEQQHQQNGAEDERPVFGIGGDLLIEPDQRHRADRRPPEKIHSAEDRHDDHLGRFRPEYIVGKHTAAEQAVECPGEPGKSAGDDKGGELVGAHI